jgi:hypothetical protein
MTIIMGRQLVKSKRGFIGSIPRIVTLRNSPLTPDSVLRLEKRHGRPAGLLEQGLHDRHID